MHHVNVSGIEVVQAVQSAKNDVPLVLGKRTFVRVYLTPQDLNKDVRVRGHLSWRIIGNNTRDFEPIQSLGSVLLRKNGDHPSLFEQRLNWSRSLNFELPPKFFLNTKRTIYKRETEYSFFLERLEALYPEDVQLQLGRICSDASAPVKFSPAPEFHCRAIVFRYLDPQHWYYLEPHPAEVDLIRRFVECAFPVWQINWSVVQVDASEDFRALDVVAQPSPATEEIDQLLGKLLRQTLALRNEDIFRKNESDQGYNIQTLYLGVIADPSGRYGGIALDAPDFPAPHIVAVTSVDSDGQLGAHEIAHILGRKHPGVPDKDRHGDIIGQTRVDDKKEINPFGFLSNGKDKNDATDENNANDQNNATDQNDGNCNCNEDERSIHLGLDARPGTNPPRVLHYARYFDLMTYRHPKWISEYTYKGIYERLVWLQDIATKGDGFRIGEGWTVIGEYDSVRNTGKIVHVLQTNYTVGKVDEIKDLIVDGGGTPPQEFPVELAWETSGEKQTEPVNLEPVYTRSSNSDLRERFGLFQYTAPADPPPKCIHLRINGDEVDQYGPFDAAAVESAFGAIRQILEKQPELIGTIQKSVKGPYDSELATETEEEDLEKSAEGIALFYSVADNCYRFRFKWPVSHLARTTTIQCQQPGEHLWETIAVTNRPAKDVSISPVFFGQPLDIDPDYRKAKNKTPIGKRAEVDYLQIRVKVTIGFRYEFVYENGNKVYIHDIKTLDPTPQSAPSPHHPPSLHPIILETRKRMREKKRKEFRTLRQEKEEKEEKEAKDAKPLV